MKKNYKLKESGSFMSSIKVPFVDFGAQYRAHKEEYDEAITRTLESGQLILQEEGEKFEENLAKFLGMKYVVAVANGTDAIMIALKAKGRVSNEQLSTSSYTFKATAEAIKHAGYTPVFKDVSAQTIEGHRGSIARMPDINGYVSVPVHIEGMVYPSEGAVMEDAAQAIGAKGVGKSGTVSYSFYPAKILGCFGDGGAIATNDKDVYEKAKLYRHHWQTNENEEYAYNSRLDNVQAAFLNVKLKYLPEILARREEIAMKYKALEGLVGLPYYQEGRVWQDYVVTTPHAKRLQDFLAEKGIQTLGQGMTPPHIALNTGQSLPNVEKLYTEMLRLPCNETLTNEQVDYVIESVRAFRV